MEYCLVRRAVGAVVVDSDDVDRNPDSLKVQGSVTFTPMLRSGESVQVAGPDGPMTIVPAPITVRISDGIIMHRGGEGVKLFAAGPGSNPEVIRYKATFNNMQAAGWAFTLAPVTFNAIPDGEVDLTLTAPIAGTPEPIVRGPAGVSLHDLTVDGTEMVVTVRSESGVHELKRIPLSDVVAAQAEQAATTAATNVSNLLEDQIQRAKNQADRATLIVDDTMTRARMGLVATTTGEPAGLLTGEIWLDLTTGEVWQKE